MDDPQVDDYVRWGDIEGWVYFKDSNHYITIEIGVRPKPNCEYTREEKHKYIHTRKNRYGKTLEDMEVFIRQL